MSNSTTRAAKISLERHYDGSPAWHWMTVTADGKTIYTTESVRGWSQEQHLALSLECLQAAVRLGYGDCDYGYRMTGMPAKGPVTVRLHAENPQFIK